MQVPGVPIRPPVTPIGVVFFFFFATPETVDVSADIEY